MSVSVSVQNDSIWPIASVVSDLFWSIGICLEVGIGIGQTLNIGPSLLTSVNTTVSVLILKVRSCYSLHLIIIAVLVLISSLLIHLMWHDIGQDAGKPFGNKSKLKIGEISDSF